MTNNFNQFSYVNDINSHYYFTCNAPFTSGTVGCPLE